MPGLATLLMLADGRYPAGGHAHSGGLEAAIAAGRVRNLPDLAAFLRGRLSTAGLVTAAFAAAACARAQPSTSTTQLPTPNPTPAIGPSEQNPTTAAGPPEQNPTTAAGLSELDLALDARTPSPALRLASRYQGRALARAARACWALPPLPPHPDGPHHPVVLGAASSAAGLSPEHAALAAAYGSIAGPASAAVRLLGLDPFGAQAVLTSLAAECERVADAAAARCSGPVGELPATSAPLLDIGAEDHASWEVRLFAS
jgi:urease accessory protein